MYKVFYSKKYRKKIKLMKKRGYDLSEIENVINKLRRGEDLDWKYRDHQLEGNKIGLRECHIKPNWLLIYRKQADLLIITLLDTGTHEDVF